MSDIWMGLAPEPKATRVIAMAGPSETIFRIDGDHGSASGVMLLDALIDEFELRIAIGVRGAFGGLVRRLKAVARRVQELPHLLRTDTKPLLQELACQLPCALGRPAKRRLGVAARDGVDSDSNASTNCGLVSSRRGLPPPGRRT